MVVCVLLILLGLLVTLTGSVLGWTDVGPLVVYGWLAGGLGLAVLALLALARAGQRNLGSPGLRPLLVLYLVLLGGLIAVLVADDAFIGW